MTELGISELDRGGNAREAQEEIAGGRNPGVLQSVLRATPDAEQVEVPNVAHRALGSVRVFPARREAADGDASGPALGCGGTDGGAVRVGLRVQVCDKGIGAELLDEGRRAFRERDVARGLFLAEEHDADGGMQSGSGSADDNAAADAGENVADSAARFQKEELDGAAMALCGGGAV